MFSGVGALTKKLTIEKRVNPRMVMLKNGVRYCTASRWLGYCAFVLIIFLCSCGDAQRPPGGPTRADSASQQKKILIAYYSRTGNTREVANQIQQILGGDLIQIETAEPYPTDYQTAVEQVARENEIGYLPPLKTRIERIEQYDLIFLGFPTWGMQLPPPIKSFLKQNSFKGKTVIPFNTNAGYGTGTSFTTVRELCQDCIVLDGFTTRGGIERDGIHLAIKDERAEVVRSELRKWLRRIKVY
jgi:flavodoxin